MTPALRSDWAEDRVGLPNFRAGHRMPRLLTPTHPVAPEQRQAKWEAARPITVGDNVWLGGGVIVCPGATIGENTVVGAGAVEIGRAHV